jgi:hypothetical protein
MQTAETILTIGALVILGLFTLSLNANQTRETYQMYQSQQLGEALLVAQRFIEEAEQMYFDNNFTSTTPDYFCSTLGPESGETYSTFDDVDDFNNYQVNITTGSIPFKIKTTVTYADGNNNYAPTTSRTYFKIMTIEVSAVSDPNQKAILSKLYSYHYFFSE